MGIKLRSRGPLLFAIIVFAVIASYYFYSQCIYPINRSLFITWYGVLSLVSVVFLSLYMLRSKTYNHRLGTRQSWLQAHLYAGIICLVVMFLHIDLRPTGTFSVFLTALFFLVVISGIAGSLIYWYIPLTLSKYGRTIMSEEEIESSMAGYLEEADVLVSGTSEECKKIYREKLRPFLSTKRTRWEYLLMTERELLDRRRNTIEACRKTVPGRDVHDLLELSSLVIDKEKLAFMQAKLKLQSAWLVFHAPLTLAMLIAAGIHIVTVAYY